jgi:DNA-binding NtrC family response regulator
MNLSPTKVIVIHDDLEKNDPLIISIQESYGKDNTLFFKKSDEGLEYVLNNLTQKLIVLLDLNFKANEPSGVDVFESIREKTSLVYIIIMTASSLNSVNNNDLVKFINNDALAFIQSTDNYQDVLKLIDKAAHQLDVRVDSVLEEWITKLSDEERQKPYLKLKEDKEFSLDEILTSIREQGDVGKMLEKNILKLAIDLLTRQKRNLNE